MFHSFEQENRETAGMYAVEFARLAVQQGNLSVEGRAVAEAILRIYDGGSTPDDHRVVERWFAAWRKQGDVDKR